jgi:hypothetical protein
MLNRTLSLICGDRCLVLALFVFDLLRIAATLTVNAAISCCSSSSSYQYSIDCFLPCDGSLLIENNSIEKYVGIYSTLLQSY